MVALLAVRGDRTTHTDTTSFPSSGLFGYQSLVWHCSKGTWSIGSQLDVIVNRWRVLLCDCFSYLAHADGVATLSPIISFAISLLASP